MTSRQHKYFSSHLLHIVHILNIYISELFGSIYSLTKLLKVCCSKIGNSCCKHPLIYPSDWLTRSSRVISLLKVTSCRQVSPNIPAVCCGYSILRRNPLPPIWRNTCTQSFSVAIVFQPTSRRSKCNFQVTSQMLLSIPGSGLGSSIDSCQPRYFVFTQCYFVLKQPCQVHITPSYSFTVCNINVRHRAGFSSYFL